VAGADLADRVSGLVHVKGCEASNFSKDVQMPYFQQSAINTQKIDCYFNKPFVLRNTTIYLIGLSWNTTRFLPGILPGIFQMEIWALIAMINEAMSSEYT